MFVLVPGPQAVRMIQIIRDFLSSMYTDGLAQVAIATPPPGPNYDKGRNKKNIVKEALESL